MDTEKRRLFSFTAPGTAAGGYRHTAAALRKMGHEVFTPTHTGVGERAHQADERITC